MMDPICTSEYRWTDARLERLAARVKAKLGIAAEAPASGCGFSSRGTRGVRLHCSVSMVDVGCRSGGNSCAPVPAS